MFFVDFTCRNLQVRTRKRISVRSSVNQEDVLRTAHLYVHINGASIHLSSHGNVFGMDTFWFPSYETFR
jgi:hypothetical protein